MKLFLYTMVIAATLALRGMALADHDKTCQNVHGKVTVVTEDGIAINDKIYKVGKTTRLTKRDKPVKLSQISAGDIVCIDTRGKDDVDGEVAGVTVLSPSDPLPDKANQKVHEEK